MHKPLYNLLDPPWGQKEIQPSHTRCFFYNKNDKAIQEIYHKQGTKLNIKWNFLLSSHFAHNPKEAMRCEVFEHDAI